MKKFVSIACLFLTTLLVAQTPLSRSARIDSMCNSLSRKKESVYAVLQYTSFYHDGTTTKQDIDEVVYCYETRRDTVLTIADKLAIASFRVSYHKANNQLAEAITVSDAHVQEAKRDGSAKDLASAYNLLAGTYMVANMQEESVHYSRLEYETICKIGTPEEIAIVQGRYSWGSYVLGATTNDTARLDTAAMIQKDQLRYYLSLPKKDTAAVYEGYKTYLMTLMRLKRYPTVITVAKEALLFAYADTSKVLTNGKYDEHGTWNTHYKIHFISSLARSYTSLGNKDSAFYYLNQPENFTAIQKPNTFFASELGHYLGFTHFVDRVRAYIKFGLPDNACKLLTDALYGEKRFTSYYEITTTRALAGPIFEEAKMYKEAAECYKLTLAYNDSLAKEETNARAISEHTNAELAINLTKNATAAKVAQMTAAAEQQTMRRNVIIGSAVLVTLLLLIFLFIINKRFKVAKEQKSIIERKEKQTQEQNQIITEQKHIVEEKQKEILDSITYAKRIQQTLLAKDDLLKTFFNEYFTLYQPKDIVSGDFYWGSKSAGSGSSGGSEKSVERFYLAVCDSTGHGVPGAFMSLLNTSFLNEAIAQEKIEAPNEILNYVRNRLISGVSQDGGMDGMDGILLCIDKTSNEITFAGAHNSLVLVRDGVLQEFKTDKMPIGAGHSTASFTLHSLKAQKGDIIYLYTDGYADQFGGPKGKKFKYKQLNETILSISSKPLAEQRDLIRATFENWRGNLEQIDDVCVVAFTV